MDVSIQQVLTLVLQKARCLVSQFHYGIGDDVTTQRSRLERVIFIISQRILSWILSICYLLLFILVVAFPREYNEKVSTPFSPIEHVHWKNVSFAYIDIYIISSQNYAMAIHLALLLKFLHSFTQSEEFPPHRMILVEHVS